MQSIWKEYSFHNRNIGNNPVKHSHVNTSNNRNMLIFWFLKTRLFLLGYSSPIGIFLLKEYELGFCACSIRSRWKRQIYRLTTHRGSDALWACGSAFFLSVWFAVKTAQPGDGLSGFSVNWLKCAFPPDSQEQMLFEELTPFILDDVISIKYHIHPVVCGILLVWNRNDMHPPIKHS